MTFPNVLRQSDRCRLENFYGEHVTVSCSHLAVREQTIGIVEFSVFSFWLISDW